MNQVSQLRTKSRRLSSSRSRDRWIESGAPPHADRATTRSEVQHGRGRDGASLDLRTCAADPRFVVNADLPCPGLNRLRSGCNKREPAATPLLVAWVEPGTFGISCSWTKIQWTRSFSSAARTTCLCSARSPLRARAERLIYFKFIDAARRAGLPRREIRDIRQNELALRICEPPGSGHPCSCGPNLVFIGLGRTVEDCA